MTENEAIAKIEYRIETASSIAGRGIDGKAFEDLDIAISTLEEIQQYRALGTVEELREAMEKQVPKKPHPYIGFDGMERNGCPNCFENSGRNEILYAGQKYCSVCGKKIDWRDEE